jgi:hypothetical protein
MSLTQIMERQFRATSLVSEVAAAITVEDTVDN